MRTPARVYLVRGDTTGWAIDEDRRLTRASLERLPELVEFVESPADAGVIHSVWWEPLMELAPEAVAGRLVICHFEEDPRLRLSEPAFAGAMARVDHWIAQSSSALAFLRHLGVPCSFVPYAVDARCFADPPEPPTEFVRRALDAIPEHAYAIANFHRDTLGTGYATGEYRPKLKKGPDVFAEVLGVLRSRGLPVVALLAGPRRHWLRDRLDGLGVPFVFAGEAVPGDDYPDNVIPLHQLAHLYRAADLHLSCSRHEGGPRGVLEAAAAGLAQLSTPVGIAPDVLPEPCIFTDAIDAADRIEADIRDGLLGRFVGAAREMAGAQFNAEANVPRWRRVYEQLLERTGACRVCHGSVSRAESSGTPGTAVAHGGDICEARPPARAAVSVRERPRRISFWNEFHPPPWGGGNQFTLALMAEAERQGIEVCRNGEGAPATVHLLNSCWFEVERFERVMAEQAGLDPRVVQRIDGPINLYRRTPDSMELDRLCFDLNRRYAHATVVQSSFTLAALAEGGYRPARPVVIHNAVDPGVFSPASEPIAPPAPGERLRVIAASWSNNPGKGAAVYRWLDEHADHDRFEFTFAGRVGVALRNWRLVDAQPSAELAALYREHHVYLTASRDDPCSNALIEAQTCGLPAVYFQSGGHPEVVQFGGLPFRSPMQIPSLLERLRMHLCVYRGQLSPPGMRDVARRYLQLLLGDSAYRS